MHGWFERHRKRQGAAIFVGVLGLLLLASGVQACNCALEDDPPQVHLRNSAAVFSGRVLRIENKQQGREVWFRVDRTWKGAEAGWVRVATGFNDGDCGYPFKKDQSYLVYAVGSTYWKGLYTGICQRTMRLPDAGADLAALGPGHPPMAPWVVLTGLTLIGLAVAVHLCRRARVRSTAKVSSLVEAEVALSHRIASLPRGG